MTIAARYVGGDVVELTYGRRAEGTTDTIFALASGLTDTLTGGVTVEEASLLIPPNTFVQLSSG